MKIKVKETPHEACLMKKLTCYNNSMNFATRRKLSVFKAFEYRLFKKYV